MAVLEKYDRQIEQIQRGLENEAYKILAELQKEIVKLNTDKLMQGLTTQGTKLKPDYRNERYKRAKNRANPLPGFGTPDLKLTGKFHANFYLVAKNKKFEILSSDEKTGIISQKYGKDNVFGLTVEDNKIVNYQMLEPRLMKWVLSKIKI